MSKIRRKNDAEFREGAVRLVAQTDKSIIAIARDLVVLAATGRLLVHADMGRRTELFDALAPGHGPFDEMPGLLPAGAQQSAGAGHVALAQDVDGQTFEQDGEAGHGLGPREAGLDHTVVGTVDPRRR